MTVNFSNDWINTSKPVISISQVIGMICKPKDQEAMLENTYNKHHNNPQSEYYQLSKEEIKSIWENKGAVSMQYGSLLDDFIGVTLTGDETDREMYELDNDVDNDERLKGLVNSFKHYYESLGSDWSFINREQTLYLKVQLSEDPEDYFYIKGRFDALWKNNRTNQYFIKDWKSSKSIDQSNRYEKLLGPAKFYDNCNYITYTLQTQFYKYALLEGPYFDEQLNENDIDTMVVQLPGFTLPSGLDFATYKPAIPFSKTFLNQIFVFAYKKKILMDKKNG